MKKLIAKGMSYILDSEPLSTKKKALITLLWPLLYIVGMGVSNYIVYHRYHISYDSNEYATAMLPFLAVLGTGTLICFITQKARLPLPWKERGRLSLFLIFFLPLTVAVIYYLVTSSSVTFAFFAPLAAALLVGIAEETMFRRILYVGLLRVFSERDFKKPLLISAALFSLLHAVNFFAGSSISQVLVQLVATFVAGVFYILMYEYTGNIYLMILLHSLWDYVLISGAAEQFPVIGILMGILQIAEIIIMLILFRQMKKRK